MLNLTGTVINVFTQQGGTNKKANLLKIVTRCNYWCFGSPEWWNQKRVSYFTVENYRDFKDLLNQKISIPVGVMAMGRNVIFTLQKAHNRKLCRHKNF